MSTQVVVFWFLAIVVGISAIVATFARNIVNSAYALFFALLGIAGVYVLLDADFLAVTQVVIYVGGILVLLLFGVLLTNRNLEDLVVSQRRPFLVGIAAGAAIFAVLLVIFGVASWPVVDRPPLEATTSPIGFVLLQNYLIPFEFSSLTLLAALIGAAYLVRGRGRD
jgi:NADH-quinone oxidoreductase subunit J